MIRVPSRGFFPDGYEARARIRTAFYSPSILACQREKTSRRYKKSDAPYGYDVPAGDLVVNEGEATVVRRICLWQRRGMTLAQIADHLNRDRVPTKRGGAWSARQVFRIVRSQILRGDLKWGDVVARGHHEPIIRTRRERDG